MAARIRSAVRAAELIPGFEPESELERALDEDADLIEGLAWGKTRSGHPEGSVGRHVGDLLRRIELSSEPAARRAMLRLVALVHDSFKYRVNRLRPKTGENHHAMRARRHVERLTTDERLLSTIELHDRPYAIWRRLRRTGKLEEEALDAMLARIPDQQLFLRFVELDGSSAGKDPEPVRWFREELRSRGGRS